MTTPYLTEERLRVLGMGGDLDAVSSAQIRNVLVAASAKVDSWCNVPRLPQPHSFLGGTITNERQTWFSGDSLTPSQKIIWPRHKPLKAVTAFRIYVTNTQYTDFDPSEIFIDRDLGMFQLVSLGLTSVAPLGAFVLPNIGLQQPKLEMSYSYGYEYSVEDEILEATDAQLYRAVNQFWDTTTVEVQVAGSTVAADDYTVDRTEGTIAFDSAIPADSVVTASYSYTLPQEIAIGTGLVAIDILNESALQDGGMGNVRSLSVGEIKIDRGMRWEGTSSGAPAIKIPAEAEGYLAPFRFVTVR